MSLPTNISRTRAARVEVATRLVREAENRLRHAATVLTNAASGFPIGDPAAEKVAETIREFLTEGTYDFETIHLELENLEV